MSCVQVGPAGAFVSPLGVVHSQPCPPAYTFLRSKRSIESLVANWNASVSSPALASDQVSPPSRVLKTPAFCATKYATRGFIGSTTRSLIRSPASDRVRSAISDQAAPPLVDLKKPLDELAE